MAREQAGKKTREGGKALARAAAGDYAKLFAGGGKATTAVAPESQLYGVFQPELARTLSDPNAGPILGPLNDIALRHAAEEEVARYEKQLQLTRDAQMGLQRDANRADLAKIALGKSPDDTFLGTTLGIDEGYGVIRNPDLVSRTNTNIQRELDADNRATEAGANKDNYDAGLFVDPQIAADRAANLDSPLPQEKAYGVIKGPVEGTYRTSNEQITDEKNIRDAANDATTAQAAMVRANKPGGGDGPTFTIIPPMYPGGKPQVTVRGKGNDVAQYMDGAQMPNQAPPKPKTVPDALYQRFGNVQPNGTGYTVQSNGRTYNYTAQGKLIQQ